MLARVWSAAVFGIQGYRVSVEADVSHGFPRFRGTGVPSLAEVLNAVGKQASLYLELKSRGGGRRDPRNRALLEAEIFLLSVPELKHPTTHLLKILFAVGDTHTTNPIAKLLPLSDQGQRLYLQRIDRRYQNPPPLTRPVLLTSVFARSSESSLEKWSTFSATL